MLLSLHKAAQAIRESACPSEQLLQQDPLLQQGIPGGKLLHHSARLHPVAALLLPHQSPWFHHALILLHLVILFILILTFFFALLIVQFFILIFVVLLIFTIFLHFFAVFTEICVGVETKLPIRIFLCRGFLFYSFVLFHNFFSLLTLFLIIF